MAWPEEDRSTPTLHQTQKERGQADHFVTTDHVSDNTGNIFYTALNTRLRA